MAQLLRILVVILLLSISGRSAAAEDASKVEGRWKIISVEYAGISVPGFKDAQVMLGGGKRVLTFPDGRVEKGTYRIDADKRPGQMDATTEGREGIERGIYLLERDVLKLCIARNDGPRPREFATKIGSGDLLIVLRRVAAKRAGGNPAKTLKDGAGRKPEVAVVPKSQTNTSAKPAGPRTFRMGFTGFVYDMTLEAVAESHKFVRENGDLLAHHIEGAAWGEALRGEPFPAALLKEWEGKKSAMPPSGQVYLAVSPGRGELKVVDKAGPLPDELKGKPYDDPVVMETYLKYCRRAIEFFEPDYLAIGIEMNEIHNQGEKAWQAYATLHRHVYTELKKEHPDLPISASWTLHHMFQKRGGMLEAWKALMPYNDLIAVSYYPFMVADAQRLEALDWMTREFDEFKKPYAFVETNDAAERLPLPEFQVVIEGTPQKQEAYYRRLLALAQERDFAFVVSFIHQDYDALWEKIKSFAPGAFIAWRDCGLLDETGAARPAYDVWKEYFGLPLEK